MGGGPSRRTLEEENQIAQMSQLSLSSPVEAPMSIIQNGPLFAPENRDGLIRIINQLGPVSFLRFSRTCKDIHNFCYNTKEIEVQFGNLEHYDNFECYISVNRFFTSFTRIMLTVRLNDAIFGPNLKIFSEENLDNLLKPPFTFNIRRIDFCTYPGERVGNVDSRALEELTTFLRRFHCVRIGNMDVNTVEDWNVFAQFIKEFGAKKIFDRWLVPLPLELLAIFISNVDHFEYYGHVPDDLILSSTSKCLDLPGAAISKETFKELLKRFRAGSIHRWFFGRERRPGEEDPFLIDACSEVMEVVRVQEIEQTIMKPGVLYVVPEAGWESPLLCILRSDGSFGKIFVSKGRIHLGS